jgi:deoxyribodipyrimidine photo-lyase
MSRDQRVEGNHALIAAQQHALALNLPLAVVFCLYPKAGKRARDHYAFMLTGLNEVENKLNALSIPFMLVIGKPYDTLNSVFGHTKPAAIYYDYSPLRGPRNLQSRLAEAANTPSYTVDTHNIVPVWVASDKREVGAYTMRPKLQKLFGLYLSEPDDIVKHPHIWPGTVKSMKDLHAHIEKALEKLPSNGTKIHFTPGADAANYHLDEFIKNKLNNYAVDRNDPSTGSQSDLSPYLHFGQISSLQVALKLREVAMINGSDLHYLTSAKMPQPEEAKKTVMNGIDSLIEEMVVRKELADNYCHHCKDYDNIAAAPDWAKKSLDAHRDDKREHIYTLKELEHANTHDDAWNAAQKQLTTTGKMHGYMRMYWAKKVLEWTESPEQAIEFLIHLNDFYSIDGGDPNGYAGILWSVAGVHDRPWFDRPVFGVIRYMNYEGLKRKFKIEAYCSQHAS